MMLSQVSASQAGSTQSFLITTSAVLLVVCAAVAFIACFYFFRSRKYTISTKAKLYTYCFIVLCSDPYEDEINDLNRNLQ